jgi:phage-related protein
MGTAVRVISLLSETLAILVLWPGPASADYEPIPLYELIGGSEIIVLGTIAKVQEHTFLLEDFRVVFGSTRDEPLEVKRFVDWSGNARWTDYRSGQMVLLFLIEPTDKVNNENHHWQIRGAGGEGEMPVEEDFIYCHGLYLKGFNQHKFRVQQGTLHGYQFDFDTFLSALEGYKHCFSLEGVPGAGGRSLTMLRVCDDVALESYQRKSMLHRYLVKVSLEKMPPG